MSYENEYECCQCQNPAKTNIFLRGKSVLCQKCLDKLRIHCQDCVDYKLIFSNCGTSIDLCFGKLMNYANAIKCKDFQDKTTSTKRKEKKCCKYCITMDEDKSESEGFYWCESVQQYVKHHWGQDCIDFDGIFSKDQVIWN